MPSSLLQEDSRYPIELHSRIDKRKTQPSLKTPEGRALWTLYVYISTDDDGRPAGPDDTPSAADTCAVLYDILGRFGLGVE